MWPSAFGGEGRREEGSGGEAARGDKEWGVRWVRSPWLVGKGRKNWGKEKLSDEARWMVRKWWSHSLLTWHNMIGWRKYYFVKNLISCLLSRLVDWKKRFQLLKPTNNDSFLNFQSSHLEKEN